MLAAVNMKEERCVFMDGWSSDCFVLMVIIILIMIAGNMSHILHVTLCFLLTNTLTPQNGPIKQVQLLSLFSR